MRLRVMGDERGNVLAIATILLTMMMMIGLASASVVDNQSGQSAKERVRESTFNLTEGVLTSQTYVLGRLGSGTPAKPFPNTCTPATSDHQCAPR